MSCVERLKQLDQDHDIEALVEAQLKWPLGLQPGRQIDTNKPISVVQTSDLEDEVGLSETPSSIVNNIIQQHVESEELVDWGLKDVGVYVDGIKKALHDLQDSWGHKFKQLKMVIDQRCAERLQSVKSSMEAEARSNEQL